MSKSESHLNFLRGVSCALVEINRHDIPSLCAEVIQNMGYSKTDFKHIDGYDKEKLEPIFKELKQRK